MMKELFLVKVNLIVSRGGYSSTLESEHLFVPVIPPGILYGNPPGFTAPFTAVGSNISTAGMRWTSGISVGSSF